MLFEILNTIWLFFLALSAVSVMLAVWFVIALWNSIRQQSKAVETVIYKGGDDD